MALEIILLLLAYIAASVYHYYSKKARQVQERLFDPYLQLPNVRFNASAVKKAGEYRVLCLGGSTTNCEELPVRARYPTVLQAILRERYPSAKIEVLNAGRPWYTTKHSLIGYTTYYQLWEPDLIVLMHAMNDLYRSFSPPRYAIGGYNIQWSHFYGPAINCARQRPRITLEQKIWKNTRQAFGKLTGIRYPENTKEKEPPQEGGDYPLERFVSIKMFEEHLRRIARCVKNDNRDMLLVSQPSLYKEKMDPEELEVLFIGRTFCYSLNGAGQKEFPDHGSLLRAMRAFNDVTKRVALSENAFFADAADRVPKNLRHFINDAHYKEPGAKRLAEEVAKTIIESDVIGRHLKKAGKALSG